MNTDTVKFNDLRRVTALHGEEIAEAVQRVTSSGWYLRGEETRDFEEAYARYIGTSEAIGVANGLDALILIFRALLEAGCLQPGDEVAVPSNTFIASILGITENGLRPLLVEPDPVTMQMDAASLEKALTPRTKAVLLVHLYGLCAYTPALEDVISRHKLLLVEDNAQAHGCLYQGSRRTGSLGIASAHSFYPGKNLGALGDGGAVTTSDPGLADLIRALGNYGSQKKYVFRYCGRNSRLDELQAAVLNVKLRHLDADNARRVEIARIYQEGLKDLPGLVLPGFGDEGSNVFHIYPLRVAEGRDALQIRLKEAGVQTLIHYPIPPHMQECYRGWGLKEGDFPIAEKMARSELSLPIHAAMHPEEAQDVVRCLKAAVE